MHALRIPLSHLDRFQDLVVRAQTIMNTGVINLRSEVFHAVSRIIGYPIASPRLFERAIVSIVLHISGVEIDTMIDLWTERAARVRWRCHTRLS
jgi:hypothetical protein